MNSMVIYLGEQELHEVHSAHVASVEAIRGAAKLPEVSDWKVFTPPKINIFKNLIFIMFKEKHFYLLE